MRIIIIIDNERFHQTSNTKNQLYFPRKRKIESRREGSTCRWRMAAYFVATQTATIQPRCLCVCARVVVSVSHVFSLDFHSSICGCVNIILHISNSLHINSAWNSPKTTQRRGTRAANNGWAPAPHCMARESESAKVTSITFWIRLKCRSHCQVPSSRNVRFLSGSIITCTRREIPRFSSMW